MNDISGFDNLYKHKLQPCIKGLQQKRKTAGRWGIASVFFGLLIFPALAYCVYTEVESYGWLLMLLAIGGTAIGVYNYTEYKDSYDDAYKQQVVKQVIKLVHPGLQYKPDLCINHADYSQSSLCRDWYDDYDGEDWIGGNYKGIDFKCSELFVSRRSGPRNSRDVYRGLFFVAPLPISFNGGTYIWVKDNVQLPATMADERYGMLPMPEVIKVNCSNGEFEKTYSVYTTNVNEASLLINNRMMKAVSNFRTKVRKDITLSFVSGICYVAIPMNKNLFEAPDEEENEEAVKEYFFSVQLILDIINELLFDTI